MSDAAHHNPHASLDREPRLTVAEFLVHDGNPDAREQLIDGHVVAMAPPSRRHAYMVGNLTAAIARQLNKPCRVGVEMGVYFQHREDAFYVADLVVQCEPHDPSMRGTDNPKMIVEVTSPSTARRDFGDKLLDYQRIPSLSAILLLDSTRRVAWLSERDGDTWRSQIFLGDATLTVRDPALSIDLSEIYDRLFDDEAPAQPARDAASPDTAAPSSSNSGSASNRP